MLEEESSTPAFSGIPTEKYFLVSFNFCDVTASGFTNKKIVRCMHFVFGIHVDKIFFRTKSRMLFNLAFNFFPVSFRDRKANFIVLEHVNIVVFIQRFITTLSYLDIIQYKYYTYRIFNIACTIYLISVTYMCHIAASTRVLILHRIVSQCNLIYSFKKKIKFPIYNYLISIQITLILRLLACQNASLLRSLKFCIFNLVVIFYHRYNTYQT